MNRDHNQEAGRRLNAFYETHRLREEGVAVTVEQLWQRINAALAEHAPATAREIRRPAPAADVERLRGLVGLDFPADLLAWWSLTDGIDDERDYGGNRDGRLVPDRYIPLGVGRAGEEYRRQVGFADPD